MKKILMAGLALSLIGAAAQAQPYGNNNRDNNNRRNVQEQRRDVQQDRQELRQDQRQFQRAKKRYHMQGSYNAPRGYTNHSWRYGERVPNGYYGGRYAITDYNRYGLYAPPRGYQWQRVGNDAVLVAITSGIVGAAIASLFN